MSNCWAFLKYNIITRFLSKYNYKQKSSNTQFSLQITNWTFVYVYRADNFTTAILLLLWLFNYYWEEEVFGRSQHMRCEKTSNVAATNSNIYMTLPAVTTNLCFSTLYKVNRIDRLSNITSLCGYTRRYYDGALCNFRWKL